MPSATYDRSAAVPSATPPGATPTSTQWSGRVTFLPDNPAARPNRGKQPCKDPECQEFTLTVPAGAKSLYVRSAWLRADYTIYLFAIDPSGKQFGVDQQDRGPLYDKQLGNSTTLPVAFLSVADPLVGDWKIRVRAAWGQVERLKRAVANAQKAILTGVAYADVRSTLDKQLSELGRRVTAAGGRAKASRRKSWSGASSTGPEAGPHDSQTNPCAGR